MWEFYDNKFVFVTGGSGFLGTAIVYRLLNRSSACHIHLLCRGGVRKLQQRWEQWLPSAIINELCDWDRLSILDGDLTLPDMGLSRTELETLRHTTNIVVHSGSSISLGKPLHNPSLSQAVIGASVAVADLAFTFKKLERFVYVSTAYANSYLHSRSPGLDLEIKEDFYNLQDQGDPFDEWNQVQKYGTSDAYQSEDFPWAYAYAKHLTERLLFHMFCEHDVKRKLLIIRPSIIGPAQNFPFPGYSMPMSTPSTVLAAAFALTPFRRVKIATCMTAPEEDVYNDEVPVDVVADRLLIHLAAGTDGCVHAVSGDAARMKFQAWINQVVKIGSIRQIPWTVKTVWITADWKSQEQDWFNRLYVVLGTSFLFSDDRTKTLSEVFPYEKHQDLQLFTRIHLGDQLLDRKKHIRYAMDKIAQNSTWAWLILNIFYRNFGYAK